MEGEILPWILLAGAAAAAPLLALRRVIPAACAEARFRRGLLFLLAGAALAAAAAGWASLGCFGSWLLLLPVILFVPVLAVLAVVAERRRRPGDAVHPPPGGTGRDFWAMALAVSLFALAVPAGGAFYRWEKGRARQWVEAASAEIRAEQAATGRTPAEVGHLFARVGRPPRLVAASPDCGYYAYPGGFAFDVRDPRSFFFTTSWHYDGVTGEWFGLDD